MTAAIPRRGQVRPVSDLDVLPDGTGLWVEVEGAARRTYRAALATVGGGAVLWNYTACQLPMDAPAGTQAFVDKKGKVVSVSGNVVGVVDASVPQGLAARFTSTGGTISVASSEDFYPSLEMFGIEGWFQSSQAAQQFTTLCEKSNVAFNTGSWSLLFNVDSAADGKIAFYSSDYGSPVVKTTVGGFNDNVRHHVFLLKLGQTFNLFVDGVRQGVGVDNTIKNGTPNGFGVIFGNSVLANRFFIGQMDNWRITRGVAPYTVSPFTVPTPPFPVGT